MSYQVLARKWRPKTFMEMVGQEHVLKALVNALDDDRLHHAYLFTGTRGVGKTSIARLFAKSLNCQQGVSSSPCGECSACVEIAEGRFVDLIEVDAASRTKVEDTRELLENVQYAPTHGRYKVYLIDEVHMLSTHSFNALLKTLEEPPPHVKFLLATTDPQKLPVTILSRCLQFNLKNMIPERIVAHLQNVLVAEGINFEEPALWLLARSADGSMRDAMSLTDQAIAFGAGEVNEADVRAMLGTIDQRLVYQMLEKLAATDLSGLIETVAELARFSPDYDSVLADLISLLHRVALAQAIPDAVDNSLGDREQVIQLSGLLKAEDVQLFYQTALMGRKDLPFVPDAREGLEMVLLRMAAFRPASAMPCTTAPQAPAEQNVAAPAPSAPAAPQPVPAPAPAPVASAPSVPAASAPAAAEPKPIEDVPPVSDDPPPWDESEVSAFDAGSQYEDMPAKKSEAVPSAAFAAPEPVMAASAPVAPVMPEVSVAQVRPQQVPDVPVMPAAALPVKNDKALALDPAPTDTVFALDALRLQDWVVLVHQLGLTGMTDSLARTLSLEVVNGSQLAFHYTAAQEAMLSDVQRERIDNALGNYFNGPLQVEFVKGEQTQETPAEYQERKRQERLAKAVADIHNDDVVQAILARFGAQIEVDTVVPIDPT